MIPGGVVEMPMICPSGLGARRRAPPAARRRCAEDRVPLPQRARRLPPQSPLRLAVILLLMSLLPAAVACSVVRPATPPPGSERTPIRLALPPASAPDRVLAHGAPLARLLERETGLRVAVSVPTSQETAVDALGTSSLDAAWLSPFAYVVARERSGAEVLLGSTRGGSSMQLVQIVVAGQDGRPITKQLAEPIPRDALAVRLGVDASAREALRAGLLRVAATDEGRRLLAGLIEADDLVTLADADFDPVRQAARTLDLGSTQLLGVSVRTAR